MVDKINPVNSAEQFSSSKKPEGRNSAPALFFKGADKESRSLSGRAIPTDNPAVAKIVQKMFQKN